VFPVQANWGSALTMSHREIVKLEFYTSVSLPVGRVSLMGLESRLGVM
jgi:hypothetical protein